MPVYGAKNTTTEITAGVDASTEIDDIKTVADGIQTDLDNGTDGLGALKTFIDAIQTDLDNGTDGLGALKTLIDAVNTDLSNGTDGLGALKALIDAVSDKLGAYTGDGGADYNDSVKAAIEKLSTFVADGDSDMASGTPLASNKSIIDSLGTNGTDTLSHDFSESGIMQFLHGMHNEAIILFVIPEAVGSINAHNSAIQTELQKAGEVVTITQADALDYPDFEGITICVLGTDNGTAWTLPNLAQIKVVPNLPLLSCDASTAAYFEIGTDGGDAAAKTAITAIANIKASILGAGFHDVTGLAVGANTVSSSTIYNTLDMSDADLTETWYAYESVNANTDVVLGEVRRIQPDGSLGVDETGVEVPATMAFYGCAYSFNDLNTLGKAIFRLLCERLIFSATIGSSLTIAGDIGDVATKLFGNISTKFSNAVPLAAFIAGNTGGLGSEMPNSISVYDLLKYIALVADGGTNAYPDSVVQESWLAYLMSKSANPVATSYDNTTDSLEMTSDKLGGYSGDGGAAQDDSTKASLDLAHTDLDAIITDVGAVDDLLLTRRVIKTVTFDGGAGSGAVGSVALFTVTGGVDISLEAFCTTLLTEAGATATIEVGIAGNTAFIIAQTNATDIDATEIWHDATPDSTIELTSDASKEVTIYGSDIIATVGAQNVTAGVITFSVLYTPRTSDGSVVEAA